MTRYVMVVDLQRCIGCQTCTATCKHTNDTPPGVQWRKVIDLEWGEADNPRQQFLPVGCQHCSDPPCMHVCPSTATRQRPDGIVTIDYEVCIGCAYCAVACPYQARYKVDAADFAYGDEPTVGERERFDPQRLGVAQKCTFCSDRIDAGLAQGLTPGVHAEASPACVNACIVNALHFGDIEDEGSNVSALVEQRSWFQMHAELGTEPGFFYLCSKDMLPEAPQ
jgi:phenylacetyl-CoA:acceptor oxidoreductase subunit 1